MSLEEITDEATDEQVEPAAENGAVSPAQAAADTQDATDEEETEESEGSEESEEALTDTADAEEAEDAQSDDSGSAKPTLTDEELDKVADTAIETLRGILTFFGAGDATIDEYEGEEGELILDVVDADLAVLIGRYGKTLDALQFLVASVVNKKIGFRYPIVIDIEGYRNRRRQKLESMARSSAQRCIQSRRDVRLRPMTPYERRIIHIILRNEHRVFTESEGEEPNRSVVIRLDEG
ncbi:MAG: KH domain-containing protein [Coriobacteriales bacterium]|jgi:spoIIIJ-associated protein|nr:KH domain-containing protein [Coriobacteriales bacterium]